MYITRFFFFLLKYKNARGATPVARYIAPLHHRLFVMRTAKDLWGAVRTENSCFTKMHDSLETGCRIHRGFDIGDNTMVGAISYIKVARDSLLKIQFIVARGFVSSELCN